MFTTLALAIAHLKVGFKGRKSSVGIYPNKLVYKILAKLKSNGLILGYGLYRSKGILYKKKNLKYNNNNRQETTNKKKNYLISVYFKYDLLYESVLQDLTLISTPGHRVYFKYHDIFKAYNKGEIYLLSLNNGNLVFTSEIILNNLKIGGEVILRLKY